MFAVLSLDNSRPGTLRLFQLIKDLPKTAIKRKKMGNNKLPSHRVVALATKNFFKAISKTKRSIAQIMEPEKGKHNLSIYETSTQSINFVSYRTAPYRLSFVGESDSSSVL